MSTEMHHEMPTTGDRLSSSPSQLSSPPRSISPASPPSQQLCFENSVAVTQYPPAPPQNVIASQAAPPVKEKKRPGRKPGSKNIPKYDADGKLIEPKKRGPRKAKDPNAPAAPQQRKRKTASLPAGPADTQMGGMVANSQASPEIMRPTSASIHHHQPAQTFDAHQQAQLGKYEDIQRPGPPASFFNHPMPPQQHQPPPPPIQPMRTSGQNYDPIRSSNYDPVRGNQSPAMGHNPFSNPQSSPKPVQFVNRASASPSISSLVDPTPFSPPSFFVRPQGYASNPYDNGNNSNNGNNGPISIPASPTTSRLAPSPLIPPPTTTLPSSSVPPTKQTEMSSSAPSHGFMAVRNLGPATVTSTASSSTAPSPRPAKPKENLPAPPPLPGTGLLQNSMFGGSGAGPKDGTQSHAPTIVLHIDLSDDPNKTVNFTKLAVSTYGWEALNPRAAAAKERLAKVAAASDAIEKSGRKESGDEMSLDLSEGEGSNVEMGGMSDGRTGTDGAKKPVRKRKMKEDEYDKEDGFVDDSELLWQETAAASKDGFFVFHGPLVPEGERPSLDRYVLQTPPPILSSSQRHSLTIFKTRTCQAWSRSRPWLAWLRHWSWRPWLPWWTWLSRRSRRPQASHNKGRSPAARDGKA